MDLDARKEYNSVPDINTEQQDGMCRFEFVAMDFYNIHFIQLISHATNGKSAICYFQNEL